jgi:hypothetical protein
LEQAWAGRHLKLIDQNDRDLPQQSLLQLHSALEGVTPLPLLKAALTGRKALARQFFLKLQLYNGYSWQMSHKDTEKI